MVDSSSRPATPSDYSRPTTPISTTTSAGSRPGSSAASGRINGSRPGTAASDVSNNDDRPPNNGDGVAQQQQRKRKKRGQRKKEGGGYEKSHGPTVEVQLARCQKKLKAAEDELKFEAMARAGTKAKFKDLHTQLFKQNAELERASVMSKIFERKSKRLQSDLDLERQQRLVDLHERRFLEHKRDLLQTELGGMTRVALLAKDESDHYSSEALKLQWQIGELAKITDSAHSELAQNHNVVLKKQGEILELQETVKATQSETVAWMEHYKQATKTMHRWQSRMASRERARTATDRTEALWRGRRTAATAHGDRMLLQAHRCQPVAAVGGDSPDDFQTLFEASSPPPLLPKSTALASTPPAPSPSRHAITRLVGDDHGFLQGVSPLVKTVVLDCGEGLSTQSLTGREFPRLRRPATSSTAATTAATRHAQPRSRPGTTTTTVAHLVPTTAAASSQRRSDDEFSSLFFTDLGPVQQSPHGRMSSPGQQRRRALESAPAGTQETARGVRTMHHNRTLHHHPELRVVAGCLSISGDVYHDRVHRTGTDQIHGTLHDMPLRTMSSRRKKSRTTTPRLRTRTRTQSCESGLTATTSSSAGALMIDATATEQDRPVTTSTRRGSRGRAERVVCKAPLADSHTASRFVGCGLGLRKKGANSDFFQQNGGTLGSPKYLCRRVLGDMKKKEEEKLARKEARRRAREKGELAQLVQAEAALAASS